MRVVPMVVTTGLPGSAGTDLKDKPCLVRKSFARSQSENLLHGPTKMWNWHSVAATVIGVFAQQRKQYVLVVWILEEAVGERRFGAFTFRLHFLEYRRLMQLEPDVDRKYEQDERQPERNPPTPIRKRFGIHIDARDADHQ